MCATHTHTRLMGSCSPRSPRSRFGEGQTLGGRHTCRPTLDAPRSRAPVILWAALVFLNLFSEGQGVCTGVGGWGALRSHLGSEGPGRGKALVLGGFVARVSLQTGGGQAAGSSDPCLGASYTLVLVAKSGCLGWC